MTTIASAPIGLPSCLATFISEIFSSSGQPFSGDVEDALLELACVVAQSGGAGVLALVVALDAVGGLVDGALKIRARIR